MSVLVFQIMGNSILVLQLEKANDIQNIRTRNYWHFVSGIPQWHSRKAHDDVINLMETFFALLVPCAGNSPVTDEFPSHRPLTELWYFLWFVPELTFEYIWVRSRNCVCLVTWFCYQLIAKPGNKTDSFVTWPIWVLRCCLNAVFEQPCHSTFWYIVPNDCSPKTDTSLSRFITITS